jgi:hypothetical protein
MNRFRPLPSSDLLTCQDFADSSASELLQELLRTVGKLKKYPVQPYRKGGEFDTSIVVYNDILSILEESILLFEDSYTAPGEISYEPLITTLIAGSVALAIIRPENGALKSGPRNLNSNEIKSGGSQTIRTMFLIATGWF